MFAAPVVLASAACTAVEGTCCVCSTACCFGKAVAASGGRAGQVASVWVLILGLGVALAGRTHKWSASQTLPSIYLPWAGATGNDDGDCAEGQLFPCSETAFVLRVGAASAMFFVLQAALCLLSPTFINSLWAFKLLMFLSMLFASQNVPIATVNNPVVLWVFDLAGFVYLVLQVMIFIEWSEGFNGALVTLDDAWVLPGAGRQQEWALWRRVLLSLDIVLGTLALAGCVLMMYSFHGCSTMGDWLASGCLVSIIVFSCVQLSDVTEGRKSNLFTSALVACYVVQLCFAATVADPKNSPDACPSSPTFISSSGVPGHGVSVYLSILFVVSSVTMAAGREGTGAEEFNSITTSDDSIRQHKVSQRRSLENVLAGATAEDYGAVEVGGVEDLPVNDTAATSSTSEDAAFNIVMALASCCWSMVLCGWGTTKHNVLWVNAVASWFATFLYLWTLAAPRLFPDRDFS